MDRLLLTQASIQTAAVLIWCVRGSWRPYPAWTFYGLAAIAQCWLMVWRGGQQSAGIWCVFSPILLLAMLDAVLELFVRLSGLYARFQRDRWRWIAIPVMAGALLGVILIHDQLRSPQNYYGALFLANTVLGSICSSVLLLGWLASTPVRLPLNLRNHLLLLAIYVGASTFAYAQYLANRHTIQKILIYVPSLVLLAWSLLMSKDGELETAEESGMPASTMEQVLGMLRGLRF